jgi:hypothetical protein
MPTRRVAGRPRLPGSRDQQIHRHPRRRELGNIGIGFAVPIDKAAEVEQRIVARG